MKSIVRRDTGEDWKGYVARLMKEEGAVAADAEPTDEEIRRFDKKRKNKKVSNDQWESPTDPDARIAKMKDGRTHLAYKAEHVVDLTSELILAAEVYTADQTDHGTLVDSVMQAQVHLNEAGVEATIQGVAADKGYHAAEQIELAETLGFQNVHSRAPAEAQLAVDRQAAGTEGGRVRQSPADWAGQEQEAPAAALRTGGTKLRPRVRLGWHAPQLAERTGGSRQRYRLVAAAHNLAVVMRSLFKIGKPRALQGLRALRTSAQRFVFAIIRWLQPPLPRIDGRHSRTVWTNGLTVVVTSTGC
jgi:hypothetical protein